MKDSGNFCPLLSLTFLAQAKKRPLTPVSLQGRTTPSVWFAQLNAADLRRFFAADGLTITSTAAEPGAETVQTVLHGRAQFSVASAWEFVYGFIVVLRQFLQEIYAT